MDQRPDIAAGPMATLTHARLRAVQGDVRAAREILEAILGRDPEHAGARELMDRLPESPTAEPSREQSDRPGLPKPSAPAPPRDKVERLEGWLDRIRRRAGDDHV